MTRRKGRPDEMIRFVLGPGDVVVPDLRRKLPGRGVWVSAKASAVAEAARRQLFSRGFRRKATASPSLGEEVDALLARDALQFLSLANKAGQATSGFGKVAEAVEDGTALGVLHARDGAADGARKLGQVLRRSARDEKVRSPLELFLSGELDLALGRSNVIHAAVLTGSAGAACLDRLRRLEAFRAGASREGAAPDGAPEERPHMEPEDQIGGSA